MEKFKAYGSLFLGMVGCFVLGTYSAVTKFDIMVVSVDRWIITSAASLMFVIVGICEIRKP